ncbi:MAG: XTP/dITP diphosphatase [Elusimicrobiota bacterium]|jgi:XTP/dITP diphosphohydrolase|nr:XTP/dITP diphosphatase [Elusimicrobiota bacterium]
MLRELILATGNDHKIKEISSVLADKNIKIIPLTAFESFPKTIEDKKTLEENAIKKAREVALFFNKWAVADDSGLEVDLLGGEPGVYSARYAGENCSYDDNNNKLLKKLEGVPLEKRTAHFRCVIAIASPEGIVKTVSGKVNGYICEKKTGSGGFGYDPIFFIPQYNKTFAELSFSKKNKISHRAIALMKAKKIIASII